MPQFTETDVELAERYATALQAIKELTQETSWNEEDVNTAETYLHTLHAIKELQAEEEPTV